MAFFSRLRSSRAANRDLGQGVWRRAHDRFTRSLDRVFQVLEGIEDDELHNQLMTHANELAELLPQVRAVCTAAHRLTPSEDDHVPGPTFDVHRALTKAANDLATTAQVIAMTRLQAEAGGDAGTFGVQTRARIVVEGVEGAAAALQRATN